MTVKTEKQTLPKYRQLQSKLITAIESGRYQLGSKLPVGRELAKTLGVSYVTLNSAMRGLEEQGYVRRVHGSGIFVTDPAEALSRKDETTSRQIGALMPLRGDLFQNFSDKLIHELDKHDYFLTPLPTTTLLDKLSESDRVKRIAKIAQSHFDSLVIDGSRHVPYNLLCKYRKSFDHITFIMHNECGTDFPGANSVLSDYRQAGYIAARKLFEAGRKKLALITFEPLSEMRIRLNGARRKGYDYEIIDGVEQAYALAGISFAENFDIIIDMMIETPVVPTEDKITHSIKLGFDGFICVGDSRAPHLYKAASGFDMIPGREIGVVGLYNTNWTDILTPKLSSISIKENEIAEITCDLIFKGANDEKVIIQPEFIDKGSC